MDARATLIGRCLFPGLRAISDVFPVAVRQIGENGCQWRLDLLFKIQTYVQKFSNLYTRNLSVILFCFDGM